MLALSATGESLDQTDGLSATTFGAGYVMGALGVELPRSLRQAQKLRAPALRTHQEALERGPVWLGSSGPWSPRFRERFRERDSPISI